MAKVLWILGTALWLGGGGGLCAMPELGKWSLHFNSSHEYNGVTKNVNAKTNIHIRIHCHSVNDQMVKIGWLLRETQVSSDFSNIPNLCNECTRFLNFLNFIKSDGIITILKETQADL